MTVIVSLFLYFVIVGVITLITGAFSICFLIEEDVKKYKKPIIASGIIATIGLVVFISGICTCKYLSFTSMYELEMLAQDHDAKYVHTDYTDYEYAYNKKPHDNVEVVTIYGQEYWQYNTYTYTPKDDPYEAYESYLREDIREVMES